MKRATPNGLTYPVGHVPVALPRLTRARLAPEPPAKLPRHRLVFGFHNPNATHWLRLSAQCQSAN